MLRLSSHSRYHPVIICILAPAAKRGKGSSAKVDQYYRGTGRVYEDATEIWDAMLLQVSLERNNNKYYVIQLIETPGGGYDVFTRWGRVDEPGQNKVVYSGKNLADAKKSFGAKFKDKTKNAWTPGTIREHFKNLGSAAKAYTLMDMADADECEEPLAEETKGAAPRVAKKVPKVRPSALSPQLQALLGLCLNEDTITEQLKDMDIDTKKMPLGRISKTQLESGRHVLEELAKVVAGEKRGNVNQLTSDFYTAVPHSFGRQRPPPLNTRELIQGKFDLINTLTDVTVVQDMLEKAKIETEEDEVDNPLDRQYQEMDCQIDTLSHTDPEYKYVEKYFDATQNGNLKLKNVFRIDRKSEAKRFAAHDAMGNRKLLWHGTNVAVVVAIIKTGLRIMPHSGGRVGRGIYHASENSKSAGYVRSAKKTGIMFINEVALGKVHDINADDWSLTKPPTGFDSILAQGWTEPDPKADLTIKLDGKDVVVPQAKAINRPEWKSSRFSQSEYLVYQESQVRMRYMLEIQFPY